MIILRITWERNDKKVQTLLKEKKIFVSYFLWNKENSNVFSAKDSIPIHQKANFIYKVTCCSCNDNYVGEADSNIVTRRN